MLNIKQGQWSLWVNILAELSAGAAESLLVITLGEVLKVRIIDDIAFKGNL